MSTLEAVPAEAAPEPEAPIKPEPVKLDEADQGLVRQLFSKLAQAKAVHSDIDVALARQQALREEALRQVLAADQALQDGANRIMRSHNLDPQVKWRVELETMTIVRA